MNLETLTHIHTLLKAEKEKLEAEYETAKKQFYAYEDSYLSGDTVTNKLTYDHYEDEMQKAFQKWGDSKRALLDFEDQDW